MSTAQNGSKDFVLQVCGLQNLEIELLADGKISELGFGGPIYMPVKGTEITLVTAALDTSVIIAKNIC